MGNLKQIGGGRAARAKYQFSFWLGRDAHFARDSAGRISDVWLAKRLCQRISDITGQPAGFHLYAYTRENSECMSSAGAVLTFSTAPSGGKIISEQLAYEALRQARLHEHLGFHTASARCCAGDAEKHFNNGNFDGCFMWALRSLTYSLGRWNTVHTALEAKARAAGGQQSPADVAVSSCL